ncbi:MAG TPA: GTPase-associated protein 1-related protein [Streptosporangiaceae bacterium]|nr:GTPase-associated protein 1-related protein [Streptosporangiaceae bacterium]
MSFQQLYYTNCEQGLSGYVGYQFNAVTDGTSAETMRTVESLTAYEPPRSTAYASEPEELERCPVNLCYAPGKTAILANVRYVGQDPSQRFGNYFAHALATSDLDADDGGLLPIELWRAGWWVCSPAPGTSLPTLEGPLKIGPLDRDQVASFLSGHPHRGRLPALLSAAALAQSRGDRSVLVVAESADDVAAWFAAVSYLLPPSWIRRLSFSTYLSRPSRSRLHLLGTLPETKLDLGPDADEKFYLFDFPGERFADLVEHPLASLCVGIGLLELPALWRWADSLADGNETTLDDWYPVVAAAAALGRVSLTEADLDAVAGWLQAGESLPNVRQNAVARALHGHPALTMDHRRTLRDLSSRTGDVGLWQQVHFELLEPLLLERKDAPAVAAALIPSGPGTELASALGRVRDRLTAKAEEQLRQAADPEDSLTLLDWAASATLPVGTDVLAKCGRMMVAPLLAGAPPPDQLQCDQAGRVTQRWPAVREGIVGYLTDLARRDRGRMAAVMAGITGELLAEQDIPGDSPVRVPYLVCRALSRRERPAAILRDLAAHRAITDVDDLLLSMLWPAHGWELADAAEVLAVVSPSVLGGALCWFEATLRRVPPRGSRTAYSDLCDDLMASPMAGQLASADRPTLHEIADLYQARAQARRLRDLLPVLSALSGRESAPARTLTRAWFAPQVATLPADTPGELVTALTSMRASAVRRYLTLIRDRFVAPDAGSAGHAAALWVIATTERDLPDEDLITELLNHAARRWRPERLEQAAGLMETVESGSGQAFLDWVSPVRPERFARVAKAGRRATRLLRRAKPGRPAKATDPPATGPQS